MPKTYDIIWNITRLCSWDCAVCCVDAIHVSRNKSGETIARIAGLSEEIKVGEKNIESFQSAQEYFQFRGMELSLDEKFKILENLQGKTVKIDFSGGDPLVLPENLLVIERASKSFGKDNVTLTATARGLDHKVILRLANLIGEFNFTYDPGIDQSSDNRPVGYALGNLKASKVFRDYGVKTRAELPLTTENSTPKNLSQIYSDLTEAKIDKLLLMRLFPVGRGASRISTGLSPTQTIEAIQLLKSLETSSGPRIKLQCALKHLFDPESSKHQNPCDLLHTSFGLMADGTLLLSPWAIDSHGKPISSDWVVGSLLENNLDDLLNTPVMRSLSSQLDQNSGHCKIFSYLSSTKLEGLSKMLDRADPILER